MNYPIIFPEISTERLTLRELSFNDKRAIFKLRSNKEVKKFITREGPNNLNDASAFIQNCLDGFENQNRVSWGIESNNNNQLIGSIELQNIHPENNYAELSYELNPDYQKEGFMTEAMKAVLDFGNQTMSLEIIEASAHKNNDDAITLLEKYAFTMDAEKKDETLEDNCIFRLDINQ